MLTSIQILLLVLISLLGIPIGYLIAKLTKEELKDGRKWFDIIAFASAVMMVVSLFSFEGELLALSLSIFAFIFFLAVVPLFRKLK